MTELTRDRKTFLRWGQAQPAQVATATDPHETTIVHEGIPYKILRLETFNKLMNSRWPFADVLWFAFGAGLVAFAAGYSLQANKPPVVIEKPVPVDKPVIIEKPMPVNSGCLAFCNR